ncbi:Tm-1-like ATP-binding domain-containing protein [Cellulomonas sp. NPDC089187]|uniref:Tm-1-like ATP-binding domain-containing protein n=1 Tax=Cellulomonas sp. NPDC089187 TaxID=3154970 RepID=UPI00341525AC
MTTVALIGTLDTKGEEYRWLADGLAREDVRALTIDVGPLSDAAADIPAAQVAEAGGSSLTALREAGDRGAALTTMARGAAAVLVDLYRRGEVDAVLSVGGSGGSSVAAQAMQALPVGAPKLLVSTMASGDVSPYVGESDVTLMYSVVDIAGINSLSEQVLGNAVAAIAGMARAAHARRERPADSAHRPMVALTMFGLTTPACDEAREELTALGYEPVVFHATGSGGRAMERLAADGFLAGVLDLTTTELADDLVGGVLTAGPDRLTAAGAAGVPQVVGVGALDMVNFGPEASVPERFAGRRFLVHNPTVTLMRTTAEEMRTLGERLTEKVRAGHGPRAVVLPLRGVSGIDIEGGPFADAEADAALFDAVRTGLSGSDIRLVESDQHINDPGFGRAAARLLHELIATSTQED